MDYLGTVEAWIDQLDDMRCELRSWQLDSSIYKNSLRWLDHAYWKLRALQRQWTLCPPNTSSRSAQTVVDVEGEIEEIKQGLREAFPKLSSEENALRIIREREASAAARAAARIESEIVIF